MKRALQSLLHNYYIASANASYLWAAHTIDRLRPACLLDVGCSDGETWLTRHLTYKPTAFHGIEGEPERARKAQARGLDVQAFDLNGRWPYPDGMFDAVHSTQVIEHIHNTRLFVSEIFRILKPGGVAVLTSENLCSLLNTSAMLLGYTPFSLQQTCGWNLGNPLGLHVGETYETQADAALPDPASPAFSGITGHVRVLGCLQGQQLLERVGFGSVCATTAGLMPLPRWLGRPLERCFPRRGHWLMLYGRKPG